MSKKTAGEFMLVPEVARYLGINEKKVYFLAKARQIPCTRVTGKWTFPKQLIDHWIETSASGLASQPRNEEERSFILAAGSDDPSLATLRDLYAARNGSASFFMATVGSSEGMKAIGNGVADVATAHLFEPDRFPGGNAAAEKPARSEAVVVQLFYRELGLVLPAGNPQGINSVRDLIRPNLRIINRQAGSGTRLYLDQQLARARLNPKKISGYKVEVSTHLDVGLAVLRGDANVGVATRTTAQLLGLDFLALTRERFDILVSKKCFFTHRIQSLLGIIGSREFRERVGTLGGYDVAESGKIIAPN